MSSPFNGLSPRHGLPGAVRGGIPQVRGTTGRIGCVGGTALAGRQSLDLQTAKKNWAKNDLKLRK